MSNCKTIAVCNQKGGVGKTTTTVNLGVGLAMQGKKVLLIDADPQGDLTTCLGWQDTDGLGITLATKLTDVINETMTDPMVGILHHEEGVDLVPANLELSAMEFNLVNAMSRETTLKNYLSQVKNRYDYVIIDCMPSLGMVTLNALSAADSVIIPVQAQYLPAKGMTQLVQTISKVKKYINPDIKIDGMLLTLVDSRTNLAKSTVEALRANFGNQIRMYRTQIPIAVKAAETSSKGKSIYAYAGAGFKIYDPQGNQVKMTFTYPTPTTIDVFYTDANGSLVTPEKLDYGKGYSIVEVQAPYGYVLDDTPVYFDITEENSTEEGGVTVVKVNKPNMAQKGTITVEKTGEVFSGVNVSGSEDSDVIYQPAYEVAGLEGAVYEVRAAEDISTPDGTLRYSKGEVVDTITTSSDGFVKSKELYLGKYEVKEITAPDGMVVSGETHTVELTYAGQNISVTETSTSFYNERQKVQVSLAKAIEKDKTFGIGDNGEIKNISFGLYAAEDIVSASGTVIPADGLIEIVSINENGTAVMKSDLPFGKYYVKENATDEHYILSDTKYPVVFEYAGQDTATVEIKVNDGKEIKNELIYGSVSGKKIDENGEALEGAVIGIFKAEETEFTKDTALMTTISAKDGSFSFEKVPYGKWIVREIEQPKGFVLDEKAYEVNISKAEQVVEIEIVNEYVHGNIRLTKVDAEYPDNKLTGATFEVYKDTNENGKIDDGDELIGNLEETETGIYEMKELLYGKYIVRETKAPEGFLLDKGEYSVFIEKDETTYSVENKAGVGFINEAMRGTLKIVKTSSDGKVKGFAFRVTGANGYDMTFETDKNGEIVIEGLRIGEYTVSEVANNASAAYITPADQNVTIKLDETAVVKMHNELRDTPKTGDDTNMKLWYVLAGLSAVGIAVTSVVAHKKKKKEGNE